MAKKVGRKAEPKNLADLRTANPGLEDIDIEVLAKLKLEQKLISMFARHSDDLDLLSRLEEQVARLQKKKEEFDLEVVNAVHAWLGADHRFADLYSSKMYLDGLKKIAKNVTKRSKPEKSIGGTKQRWTKESLVNALQTLECDSEGWIDGRLVWEAVNLNSMDAAGKRLKLVSGELQAFRKGTDVRTVEIDADHKWDKEGSRSSYKVNLAQVLNRLRG